MEAQSRAKEALQSETDLKRLNAKLELKFQLEHAELEVNSSAITDDDNNLLLHND